TWRRPTARSSSGAATRSPSSVPSPRTRRSRRALDLIAQYAPWLTNGPLVTVQVMSGLSVGMFLFLVSVGMSLIFGVTRIVNLAHGSLYMVGAYLMVTLVEVLPDRPWSFWLALLLAPLGVAALGGLIEMGLLRRIYGRDPLM